MVSGSQLLKFVYLSYWKKGANTSKMNFDFIFNLLNFDPFDAYYF